MMIDLLDVEKAEPQGKLPTIAKFAKLAGLPVSNIRYWMKEGKIKPITYTASGYAMFDEKHCLYPLFFPFNRQHSAKSKNRSA